ncbi:integrase [Gossypium australe]|uniref:Integrase n=1 Tax=Gossypium australe TaxID=47621 RepID=A0A5B6VN29_9ROSI|nr:integrase [Gossypium australe]
MLTETLVLTQLEFGNKFVVFNDALFHCFELRIDARGWLELLKDYDLIIDYHSGKANVVVDALSWKYLFSLKTMNTCLTLEHDGSILAELRAKPIFL